MPSVKITKASEKVPLAKSSDGANSYILAFCALYIVAILSKIFFLLGDDGVDTYQTIFIVCMTEVSIWALISRKYYPKGAVSVGLMLLYSAMFAYATIPVVMLAYGVNIFPFPDSPVKVAMIGQSLALSNLYLFLHLVISPRLVSKADANIKHWLLSCRPTKIGALFASFFGIFVACLYLYNFYSSGVSDIVGVESRIVVAKTFETGKAWLLQYIFFAWLMATAAVALFRGRSANITLASRAAILMAVAIFAYAYFLIGNRRELAIFLIFLGMLSIYRKRKIVLMLAAVSLPALLTVGVTRSLQGSSIGDADLEVNLINLFGEFIFPHYSLIYYSSLPNYEFQFGQSFLMLPAYAFPSFGLWEKVNSLSVQFAAEYANLNMGYALTPLAEGYINFGWASILIAPFLLACCVRLILKYSKRVPYGVLLLLAFPLDISRGEFMTIAFQWLIFTAVFALTVRVYTTHFARGAH